MIANATAAGKDDTINNEDIANANLYGVQKMTLKGYAHTIMTVSTRETHHMGRMDK